MEKYLLNLIQIFDKKFFRIPDYQRGYSWGNKQLEDFWEDIELLSESGYHYTGLLTYEKINKPKDKDDLKLLNDKYNGYYIVDGQQRLTTMSILVKCLLNYFEKDDIIIDETKEYWEKQFLYKNVGGYDYFLFSYESDNPSDYFFKRNILEKEVSNEESKQETIYTNNLIHAKNYFNKNLSKFSKEEKISIFCKLINQFKFNIYEVDSEIEVFVTFETINNRGKSLSKLELLKNRLIYLSTKISDNEEISKTKLRDEINHTWKVIYNHLGKNINNVLNDDDFLKNHWIMYFSGYNRNEANVFSKYLLNKKFTIKNIINGELTGIDIKNYVESLRLSIKNYFFILNPTFDIELINKFPKSIIYLEKLNRLSFSSFLPLIISILNKKISDEDFLNCLNIIEEFIFVIFKISRNVSTFQNSKFYKYSNEYNINSIKLKNILNELKEIKKDYTSIDTFKIWISNKFERGNGYYDWYSELRYFLFEYELSLRKEHRNNENKIIWEEFTKLKKDFISMEHIFPQSKINSESDKIKCHSLGNLVPLSVSINSKLQDKDYLEKKERYKLGSLSEIEIFHSYSEWNEENIKLRGLKLLEFMSTRWNIDLKDEANKLELLGFKKLISN